MKQLIFIFSVLFVLSTNHLFAQTGDTVRVQTFSFGSPQDAWFVFPSDTVRFEKILMQYTLKCNPAQSPACGEWDYLTYSYLYKHTGLLDSTPVVQPTFVANGASPSSISYMNTPSYTYNTSWQYQTIITNTTSLTTATIGTDNTPANHPLGSSAPVSRSEYLWKASEMTSAGLTAGNITGLQLYLQSLGSELKNLKIRLKATTADSITKINFSNTGFTTVYTHDKLFTSTGWNSLQFNTPFNWNGTSNLLVEIMYDNEISGTDNVVASTLSNFKSGIVNAGADRCLSFHSNGFVNAPLNNELAAIDSFVTVAFWAYGTPQYQPMNGTCFEAVDPNGNRVLNSHTPWSDSKVYWDAGNENGYDRGTRSATTTQIEGQWNHWVFTKNVFTQSMRMTLNGVQLQNAPSKMKRMLNIDKFRIGKGNWAGSLTYEGKMDQFCVFNTDLTLANIQKLYRNKIDASHPNYNNLVLNYNFDDGNFQTAIDESPMPHALATLNEGVNNPLKAASDLVTNFTETSYRPNIIFEQGVYTSYKDSTLVIDSTMNVPMQIVMYDDSINNPGVAVDTMLVWPAYYSNYVYNAQGIAIDSTLVPTDGSLTLANYTWYRKFPQVIRYELARYITPYGNGLSLGNGWTWTFDVSDYRTLLADSVHIAAGNWQELLDMKFIMIKGTPPRDVVDIQNVYTGGFDYGHTNDPIESHLTPKQIYIPANAVNTRWKSRVTGHGMDTPQNCAEFCPKTHYYKVNGTTRFSKLVWRDNCDVNPLYPQGGTWVYDRANWCPGAEVWTYDFELTPYTTAGTTVTLDHDVQAYTNNGEWSYYQIEDQVVSYGAPNFSLDVAMEDILSPTTNQMWLRKNPICTNPIIRIKNTGSTTLTNLTITYGVTGATPSVYNWTGTLPFMQIAEVTLGNFASNTGGTEFYVTLSNPNGGADQYSFNNTMKSVYNLPPQIPSKLVIELKTNSVPSENSYTLKNSSGTTVFQRNGLTANTTYSDTLNLIDGCYLFDLRDTGEDGLTWWANTGQGSGTIKFKNGYTGAVLTNFNSDFGGQVYQQFNADASLVGLTDYIFTSQNRLAVLPNPSEGNITVNVDLKQKQDFSIEITDMLGKRVLSKEIKQSIAISEEFDLSKNNKGLYFVILKTNDEVITRKVLIQ